MKLSDKIFLVILTLILVVGGIIGLCEFAKIRTPSTITVNGRGQVEATADRMVFYSSLYETASSNSGVMAIFKEKIEKIGTIISDFGFEYTINDRYTRTYYREYDKTFEGNSEITVHVFGSGLTQNKDELFAKISEFTNSYPGDASYRLTDGTIEKKEAVKQAYLDAQKNAKETAQLLGKEIKDLISASDTAGQSRDYLEGNNNAVFLGVFTGYVNVETTVTYSLK